MKLGENDNVILSLGAGRGLMEAMLKHHTSVSIHVTTDKANSMFPTYLPDFTEIDDFKVLLHAPKTDDPGSREPTGDIVYISWLHQSFFFQFLDVCETSC